MNAEEILARQRAQARERQTRWRANNKDRHRDLAVTRDKAVAELTRAYPGEYRQLLDHHQASGVDIKAAIRKARADLRDAHRGEYEQRLARLRSETS